MDIIEYRQIDSTNDEAKRLIEKGLSEDSVIFAHSQLSGKGRNGRTWQSPEGNLYFSIVIKREVSLADAAQLSFVAAIATGNFLAALEDKIKPQYKWPNDVLIDGQKISGILLESYNNYIIIGVGINISRPPIDIDKPSTYLAKYGKSYQIDKNLLEKWLLSFNKPFNLWKKSGFSAIRESWIENAWNLGEEIQLKPGNDIIKGIFKDINAQGELVLESNGHTTLISSGEVFF